MNVEAFATRLLFSNTLDDKLFFPDKLIHHSYKALKHAPQEPGRPDILRFHTPRTNFPSIHQLENEEGRGIALHFFANHELLAIDLPR